MNNNLHAHGASNVSEAKTSMDELASAQAPGPEAKGQRTKLLIIRWSSIIVIITSSAAIVRLLCASLTPSTRNRNVLVLVVRFRQIQVLRMFRNAAAQLQLGNLGLQPSILLLEL